MKESIGKREQNSAMNDNTVQVYDPTGAVRAENYFQFSPRIDTFSGKRIGLLWNSKPNGNHYLNRVAELLDQRFSNITINKLWELNPETANPDKKSESALDFIAQNADMVIAAQGD